MRTLILFLLFYSLSISCIGNPKKQKEILIKNNEIGVVFSNYKITVLESGAHKIDVNNRLVLLNKTDLLPMKDFDVLSSNVRSMYCQLSLNYSLSSKQVENMANFLGVDGLVAYKERILVPEILSALREIAFKYTHKELENGSYQLSDIENGINDQLKKYASVELVALKFYEK
jgi:hypothetical protein